MPLNDYDNVASRRVWATLRVALPPLRIVIESDLAALDGRRSNPRYFGGVALL
jgi:hypothetical protein